MTSFDQFSSLNGAAHHHHEDELQTVPSENLAWSLAALEQPLQRMPASERAPVEAVGKVSALRQDTHQSDSIALSGTVPPDRISAAILPMTVKPSDPDEWHDMTGSIDRDQEEAQNGTYSLPRNLVDATLIKAYPASSKRVPQ